jgi:hypothetical protein
MMRSGLCQRDWASDCGNLVGSAGHSGNMPKVSAFILKLPNARVVRRVPFRKLILFRITHIGDIALRTAILYESFFHPKSKVPRGELQ